MKKILIIVGMLIDAILWFVFLSLILFLAAGMVITLLYLPGIIKTEPAQFMGYWGMGAVLLSVFLSIGGVLTGKLPGYVRNKKKLVQGLCSFEIELPVEGFKVRTPKRQQISVFEDRLIISGVNGIELRMNDITAVGFFAGKVFLEYESNRISFIFPSTIDNISESTTTELFVAMLRGLKNREDVSEIITLIRKAKAALERKSEVIIWLIKCSCFFFLASFVIIAKHEGLGFAVMALAFLCLVALIPVSFLFSSGDYFFGNKVWKLHYYFLLAEQCLEIMKDKDGNFEQEVKQYAQEMVFVY